ncbi:hypothetical protein ACQP00_20495 [Dactylosporangium sp. CS-047395]|uniref:hypothetical protein n=1 Tax=Dactylosporangium sp. CS-047395 TaxID=3239936 RepID=UPI003D94F45D
MKIEDLLSYVCCFAAFWVPVGLVLYFWFRRSPGQVAGGAAQWNQILTMRQRYPDARLGKVVSIHQHARTGTKAWIRWDGATQNQDSWFPSQRVRSGMWYLVTGFVRYGPHRHEPQLFEVTAVLMTAPDWARRGWQTQQRSATQQPPNSASLPW